MFEIGKTYPVRSLDVDLDGALEITADGIRLILYLDEYKMQIRRVVTRPRVSSMSDLEFVLAQFYGPVEFKIWEVSIDDKDYYITLQNNQAVRVGEFISTGLQCRNIVVFPIFWKFADNLDVLEKLGEKKV